MSKVLIIFITLLMAAFSIYVGFAAQSFHPGRLGRHATGKPLPRWFGRLWFLGFAAVLLYLAVRQLR